VCLAASSSFALDRGEAAEMGQGAWSSSPASGSEIAGITIRQVILHGQVLELTDELLENHPGGAEILTSLGGQDITDEYEAAIHGESAMRWAKTFAVKDGSRRVKDGGVREQNLHKEALSCDGWLLSIPEGALEGCLLSLSVVSAVVAWKLSAMSVGKMSP
ncbi:unnamed protein product, partial [Polarella glacialis]